MGVVIDEAAGVVAAPERILGWAHMARAGDQMVYASRCWLPVASAGAAEARRLARAGLVHLKQRPIGDGVRNYIAERSSLPWPEQDVAARACVASQVLEAVYQALARTARFDRPCPSDAQLAVRLGLEPAEIAAAIDALAEDGAIRVVGMRAPTLRRVTISATGARTGVVR